MEGVRGGVCRGGMRRGYVEGVRGGVRGGGT